MRLDEGLAALAARTGLDADALIAYASEDTLGGVDTGWPGGSVWRVEGQWLYALIRALRPDRVIEIGTAAGCSAAHMLAALNANGHGTLHSYDILANAGFAIPDSVSRERWRFTAADAITALEAQPVTCQVAFEDGLHTTDFTRAALRTLKGLTTGVLVSHDAMHFSDYGRMVREAWDAEIGQYDAMLMEASDCGLAFTTTTAVPCP